MARTKHARKKPTVANEEWLRANDNLKAKGGVVNINGVDHHVGASPYTRWKASGQISATQERAIDHCIRLWELVGISPGSTTAGYGDRVPGTGQSDPEWLVVKKLDAMTDLRRVEGYFTGLTPYWSVFENCIRHDEPAGSIGSRLMGWGNGNAVAKALVTVQFIADTIADRERLVA